MLVYVFVSIISHCKCNFVDKYLNNRMLYLSEILSKPFEILLNVPCILSYIDIKFSAQVLCISVETCYITYSTH